MKIKIAVFSKVTDNGKEYWSLHYDGPKERDTRPIYGIPGDVDGDGRISSADARLALRASVGLEQAIKAGSAAYKAADADGDGKVTSADARLILRGSVGLEDVSKWQK